MLIFDDNNGNKTIEEDDSLLQKLQKFNISAQFDDVPLNGDFYWLLTCLVLCIIWIVYIVFYNSRVFGFILTKFLNHVFIPKYLYKDCKKENHPYVHIGSFSITIISGKIMFRDLIFITADYSLRIQDGWIIFRWWVPYEPKNVQTADFSQSDTRVSSLFNGFELHIFNQSQLYSELEKVFNLPIRFSLEHNLIQEKILKNIEKSLTNDNLLKAYLWKDFFPVNKFEINNGRLVFGNSNVPTTLLVTFEETHITYTSKSAISKHDLFTHICKCKAQTFKIILANSPNYAGGCGMLENAPRFMGEGFVVFQSNLIDFYYYQDEPGFANSKPEVFELSTGDTIERFTSPAWGVDVKSGKGTELRYGPWADRQRDYLYNFFFPPDFQYIQATKRPKENELRVFEKFDFRFSTLSTANIDILFTDAKLETNVMHIISGPGSYLEITVPLISKEDGYYSDIVGQILHLDSTTTLAYRPLVESETLEFKVRIEYPRMWNHHQTWHCNFTGCKTTAHLLYAHKIFFQSLIDDWAGQDRPDMLKFVPYTCKINLILKEFELIVIANEYNWIDCTSKTKNENIELAICGDTYDMSFDLSFAEFLPDLTLYKIWIQGESLESALHVPEVNPHYETIRIMDKFAKMYPLLANNDLNLKDFITPRDLYAGERKWRNIAKTENGWFTCWSVPIVAIDINYHHHPVPFKALPDNSKADEDLKLRNSRFIKNFDPGEMQPDLAEIEIEIGPSKICLHGLLLRTLWNIKENYMGESLIFNDFSLNPETNNATIYTSVDLDNQPFDDRLHRPFAVTVSLIMHDLHGHLMKNCFESDVNESDPLCPYVYLEKLCFEMDKTYRETKLQLVLSPVIVRTNDLIKRQKDSSHLNNGHLLMNSLQFRGHALFSGLGRPLQSETLEYGWLVEVEIGKLSGKLTTPQLYHLVCSLETFVFQLLQPDASLQPPVPYRKCLHDKLQTQCSESDSNLNKICPNSEDIKYKMFRFSVQSIDLCLVEAHNLLYLQIAPIKFSTCNLHSCHSNNGTTLLINNVFIKHFIVADSNLNNLSTSEHKITNLKDELKDSISIQDKTTRLSEALNIEFGPLFVDTAELLSIVESYTISQKKFLSIHDAKTKKLWFLWNDKYSHQSNSLNTKCGCVGGCAFFGNNLNGKNFFNLNTRDLVDGKIYKQRTEDTIAEKFDKSYDFMYGESLLNPGELILGLKLNSIHEESEENLNSPVNDPKYSNVSSHLKQREDFKNSPALQSNRTSSPLYLSKSKYQSSTSSMSPSLFNKNKSIYTNIKSTQSQLDTTTSTRKLHKLSLFTDKNRSLSETGIEKSSKFDKPDRLSKLKELPIDNIQSNELIKNQPQKLSSTRLIQSPSIKSIRSQQSTATANDHFFSAEELSDELSPEKIADNLLEDYESKQDDKASKKLKSSRSSSNSSFQSACSSPKEDDSNDNTDEDLNDDEDNKSYYDLRDQMEKPILESPLLMSTYSNYLTLYQCENWRPKNDSVNLLTSNYIPTVRQTTFDGLSSISLIKRRKRTPNKQTLNRQNQEVDGDSEEDYEPGSVYDRIHSDDLDSARKEGFHKTHRRQDSSERVMNLGKLEKQISKTIEIRNEKVTILVKVNGNTEIKISPLCLDGMKTFIESLTPTLAKAHPLTIVNHINTLCYNNVEAKNHLKKEKTLEYGQLKLKAWHSTMERERGLSKTGINTNQNLINQPNLANLTTTHNVNNNTNLVNNQSPIPNTNSNPASAPATKPNFFESRRQPAQQAATVITANQYEETKNTKFQLFVQISNINVYVLQVSLVEQLVDSSTIEHLNDCTCVSLVALNVGRLNFDYFNNKKERRSLHTFITNNAAQPPASIFAALTQKDLVSRLFPKKIKKEQKEVEPLTIETQELLLEETVGLGTITKLHAQLNRLKNSSSLLNDAFLTIIPKDNSKVDFEVLNLVIPQSPAKPLRKSQSFNPKSGLQRQDCLNEKDFNQFVNDNLNLEDSKPDLLNSFIMFECGLENIRVNGVKKRIITDQKLNKSETTPDFKPGEDNKKEAASKTETDAKKDEEIKVEEQVKDEVKNNQQQTDKDQISQVKNNASSLGGQIQTIWFNFAAPPKTPNTKKIDFTKLDWHLISTATPAINAWLNCTDRILLSTKKCNLYYERRVASLLACLMTEALEISGIHVQPKTRHWTNRLTPFSKSLYEDPSCQLMSVLRRYLSRFDTLKEIEQDLAINSLPPLKILRKGIISLSRSWKNALYMPLLVEQNIKLSRGEIGSQQNQTNIPLRLLINENNANLNLNEVQLRRKSNTESKLRNKMFTESRPLKQQKELPRQYSFNNREFNQQASGQTSKYETVLFMNQDDDEIVDEKMHLLFDDPNKLGKLGSEASSQQQQSKQVDELSNESSNKPRFMPNMLPRGSLAFPLLTNPLESLNTGVNKAYDFLFSNPNGTTLQSKRLKNQQNSPPKDKLLYTDSDESEFNLNLLDDDTQLENYKRSNEENLYLWTIKQKDYTNSKNLPTSFINENLDTLNSFANKNSTLRSATSDELEQNDQQYDKSIDILPGFVFVPTGIQLGDIKVIFEPLLVSLAIENLDEIDSNIAFEQLGTKISLSLIVKQFKIEIVESENCCTTVTQKVNKESSSHAVNNALDIEPSAFECDSLSIGLNLRKVKDFKSNAADAVNNTQHSKHNETEKIPIIIVGPEGGGLSEITTIVNFNIETDRITQRVNLPLLRLIHQVASVFENVKETRLVMKSNRVNKWKQSVFLGDLKNEQLLSFSLNNRQSNYSNIASTASKDHIVIDIENSKEDYQADDEKEKLKMMPTCWKNMYCLLNLYETTPETKTVTDRNSYLQKQQQQVPSQVTYSQPLSQQQQPAQQVNYSELNQHTINNLVPETRIQIDELENRKRHTTGDNQPNEQQPQSTNDEFLPNELRKSSMAIQANFNAHSHFRKSLVNVMSSDHIKTYTHALMQRELTPFVVFGVVKIKKVNLEAKLSNLKLDGELSSFHVSLTHKEKVKGASVNQKKWKESSLTGNLGYSKISILEETQFNNHQLIVQMTVGKSLTLISSQNKKGKDHNSALLKIGAINIDIPQHPVAIHNMMTRSSRQISTTLQEFKTQRGVFRSSTTATSKQSGADSFEQQSFNTNVSSSKESANASNVQKSSEAKQTTFESTGQSKDQFDSTIQFRNAKSVSTKHPLAIDKKEEKFISPIVIQFHIVLDSFEISASLLPSLKAQYNIGQIISAGITGRKAKFTIDFEEHKLSFNTKINDNQQTDSNLPSSASVSLPGIHVTAEYMDEAKKKSSSFIANKRQSNATGTNTNQSKTNQQKSQNTTNASATKTDSFADGIVLRKGSYLNALAEIGIFEHSLTTDILNHLLLVQKVFMREVNEILQKMSGFDNDNNFVPSRDKKNKPKITTRRYLLFTLHLRMKGIQITATTPTNSAVRLETGKIDLQLSNRVQNMLSSSTKRSSSSQLDLNLKLFIKLQLDLMVALGQLFQNPMYEEATPEFQQLTYFRTRIVMRNALQNEFISTTENDNNSQEGKEAVLIVLKRPLLYIQPIALDKAVLVWLNYKNAYEYWTDQFTDNLKRAGLNPDNFKGTTQPTLDKVPINQMTSSSLSTLFLQLTIDDLGICLPIQSTNQQMNMSNFSTSRIAYDSELKSAFVITLESTSISACSFNSWASKAKFTGLCIRFAEDFETSLDDWKPMYRGKDNDWKPCPTDYSVMNLCVVSGGTYEICSKTTTYGSGVTNDAKWWLNVSWRMDGFDIHVDTSIGKQLSALFKTLTALTGEDELGDNKFYMDLEDEETKKPGEEQVSSKVEKRTKVAELIKQDSKESDRLNQKRSSKPENTIEALLRDTSIDNKERSRRIEDELNARVKRISLLKQEGAPEAKIDLETRKFQELESLVFSDFARGMINKFKRRQSMKKAEFRNRSSEYSKSTSQQPLLSTSSRGQRGSSSQSFSATGQSLPFLKESTSLDSSNDIGPLSPTESEINSPLTKSYSKDNSLSRDLAEQSEEENTDSLNYLNNLLPRSFYRYKTQNPVTKTNTNELTQSTSEHSSMFQSSQTEGNLFSNLMNLPSFINTSFSSSTLPTENVLGKLFNLSPAHKSSTKLSSSSTNPNVFDFDQDSNQTPSHSSSSKPTSPLVNEFLTPNQANSSSTYLVQEPPNIDFELDIKVYFNSGKCVLHTRDPISKEDSLSNKKSASLPKDKSFSNNPYENLNSTQNSFYNQQTGYNKFYRSNKANLSGTNLGTPNYNSQPSGSLRFNNSSSRLRAGTQNVLDHTIFLIPGLDIKLHYNSRTFYPNQPSTNIPSAPTNSSHLGVLHENLTDQESQRMRRQGGTKKATCYAWMTLHSIPEETIITPHLLDFLEEALEPIPIIIPPSRATSQNNLNETNELRPDLITNVPAQYAVYGSFPVDVIVYLHVQQSVLRFSCLPTSRVECLLQLPSVDLVFSSKRIEDELSDLNSQTSTTAHCNPNNIFTHKRTQSVPGCVTFNNKFGHRRLGSDYRHQVQDTSVGGLSVTGYLADFSLYIFHPYTNTKTTISSKLHSSNASSTPKLNTERKDSLSLQVEFVKINISRSRKVTYSYNQSNLFEFSNKPSSPCSNQRITIRFSGICDIGSASFNYDIRRLNEILAFPKAWYRKTLWKRIFLGDQGIGNEVILNTSNLNLLDIDPQISANRSTSGEDSPINREDLDDKSSDDQGLKIKITSKLSPDRICEEITKEQLKKSNEALPANEKDQTKHRRTRSSDSSITHQQKKLLNTPWETLILFGVNLSNLNIKMNMGNVMGNTGWTTREFRSQGKVVIDSTGHRAMNISLGLDNSQLDAKSGIVGGQIELNKIEARLNVKEYYGLEPDHMITAKLNALQTRIDYMGSPILMLRMSNLDLKLKDEWKIDTEIKKSFGHDHPTKRPASMFIHCALSWDQLQILLSKSTTPDIIKIIAKLDEFFSKQFYSGKRVFTSLQKTNSFNRQSFRRAKNQQQQSNSQSNTQLNNQQDNQQQRPSSQLGNYQDAKHHRHWQKALKIISGVYLHNFPEPLPEIGTILGGTFELFGNNISVACFADINFRSKSWALFSLRYPQISFSTEAQESVLMNEPNAKTHIIQNFSLSLGRRQNQEGYMIHHLSSMATVCKISRTTMFPPQFKNLHEWFQYAFCASELDEVDRFPVIEFTQPESHQQQSQTDQQSQVDGRISNVVGGVANVVAAVANSSAQTLGVSFKKNQDDHHQQKGRLNSPKTNQMNHTKEIIFALPSLQLDLKTEHLQDALLPILTEPKPKVDCAFVTDFDDHIIVAVNLEVIIFLHDLISSYIKEKEVTLNKAAQSPTVQTERQAQSDKDGADKKEQKEEKIETDWREYNCQTWHLEPTVRLLSTWTGKNIEPYGVDYILQRLGFTQARITIPKWIQRGCMDPLDKVLSELMSQLILSNKTNPSSSNK